MYPSVQGILLHTLQLYPWIQGRKDNGTPPLVLTPIGYETGIPIGLEVDWFKVAWENRIPLTVNPSQIPSTQTDYPLKIDGTFLSLIGKTISQLRTSSEIVTQLPYHIPLFDTLSGRLVVYSLKPSISDADITSIYYENALAADEQDKSVVWEKYNAVNLLFGNLIDDSATAVNLEDFGNVTPLLEQGYLLDGVNAYLRRLIAGQSWQNVYSLRIDFEIIAGESGYLYQRDRDSSGFRDEQILILPTGELQYFGNHDMEDFSITTPSAVPPGFHSVVINATGHVKRELYLDGVFIGEQTGTNFFSNFEPDREYFGCDSDGGGFQTPGDFLKCNIFKIIKKSSLRTLDEIITEYNNIDTSSFHNISPVENVPIPTAIAYEVA